MRRSAACEDVRSTENGELILDGKLRFPSEPGDTGQTRRGREKKRKGGGKRTGANGQQQNGCREDEAPRGEQGVRILRRLLAIQLPKDSQSCTHLQDPLRKQQNRPSIQLSVKVEYRTSPQGRPQRHATGSQWRNEATVPHILTPSTPLLVTHSVTQK
ncbi:hypothetical protein MHYP_G00312100 [Metynnis hypsauchen]